jgi:dihydrolipoamide dehydrogenase
VKERRAYGGGCIIPLSMNSTGTAKCHNPQPQRCFMENYNLIVIGAGPGGYESALEAAKLGLKTAVVEERELGGTCLNRGCIPTKALLHSSEVYTEIQHAQKLGITVDNIGFDMQAMINRKNEVVQTLRSGIEGAFKRAKIDLYMGKGKIVTAPAPPTEGNYVVVVNETALTADNILIATGSTPFVPPIAGIDNDGVMTSDELLDCTEKISSLTIIGGGVIGLEFAQIYNALGADVTIIEAMDRVLPTLDREISQSIAMSFKKRGIKIVTGAMVESIENRRGFLTRRHGGTENQENNAPSVPLCLCVKNTNENGGKAENVSSEKVLVAIGRRANIAGLFDDNLIETERGQIKIDEHCRTNVKNVYAIGDCTLGAVQLAHYATAQGLNAVHFIAGKPVPLDLSLIPSCIYTNPEIACVGMTQESAKLAGIETKTAKYLMGANGKTQIKTDERGFVRLVARAHDGVLIGAQLFCCNATDMIGEISLAIASGLTASQVASVVHPHPTFVEAIGEAAKML